MLVVLLPTEAVLVRPAMPALVLLLLFLLVLLLGAVFLVPSVSFLVPGAAVLLFVLVVLVVLSVLSVVFVTLLVSVSVATFPVVLVLLVVPLPLGCGTPKLRHERLVGGQVCPVFLWQHVPIPLLFLLFQSTMHFFPILAFPILAFPLFAFPTNPFFVLLAPLATEEFLVLHLLLLSVVVATLRGWRKC